MRPRESGGSSSAAGSGNLAVARRLHRRHAQRDRGECRLRQMDGSEERRERAARRGSWPVRRFRLGEESEDLSAQTSATERIAMMWPLALEAWRLAGLPIPDYERKDAPSRLVGRSTGCPFPSSVERN